LTYSERKVVSSHLVTTSLGLLNTLTEKGTPRTRGFTDFRTTDKCRRPLWDEIAKPESCEICISSSDMPSQSCFLHLQPSSTILLPIPRNRTISFSKPKSHKTTSSRTDNESSPYSLWCHRQAGWLRCEKRSNPSHLVQTVQDPCCHQRPNQTCC